jgi:hypothetical protein
LGSTWRCWSKRERGFGQTLTKSGFIIASTCKNHQRAKWAILGLFVVAVTSGLLMKMDLWSYFVMAVVVAVSIAIGHGRSGPGRATPSPSECGRAGKRKDRSTASSAVCTAVVTLMCFSNVFCTQVDRFMQSEEEPESHTHYASRGRCGTLAAHSIEHVYCH